MLVAVVLSAHFHGRRGAVWGGGSWWLADDAGCMRVFESPREAFIAGLLFAKRRSGFEVLNFANGRPWTFRPATIDHVLRDLELLRQADARRDLDRDRRPPFHRRGQRCEVCAAPLAFDAALAVAARAGTIFRP